MTFVKCCSKALSFAKACSNSVAVTGRRALGVSSMGEARGVKRFLESPDDPFPDYDVSTEAAASRLNSMSRPVEEPSRVRPTGVHEATLMLAAFRPAQQGVAGLRDLLEARADPNADAGPGKLSPLRNVLCFAHNSVVGEMRQLLLDSGAVEQPDDRKRWRTRASADMSERAWLMNAHKDERPLHPNTDA